MRTQEVEGLTSFPGGKATVRELTIGEMRRLRRSGSDEEERGLHLVALALVDPVMTVDQLDAMPASAIGDLTKLSAAVGVLHQPDGDAASPPA